MQECHLGEFQLEDGCPELALTFVQIRVLDAGAWMSHLQGIRVDSRIVLAWQAKCTYDQLLGGRNDAITPVAIFHCTPLSLFTARTCMQDRSKTGNTFLQMGRAVSILHIID
jgi:hypothetical protein